MHLYLEEYIRVFPKAINRNIVESAREELTSVDNWISHKFHNPEDNTYYENPNEPKSYFGEITAYNDLMQKSYSCVAEYISDLDFPWFNSWTGMSNIKFNRYESDKEMANHCDHIREIFDGEQKGIPILTVIGALDDSHLGGELVVCENFSYKLQAGDIIIFPSVFLYPHKVTPITEGKRLSFITWVH